MVRSVLFVGLLPLVACGGEVQRDPTGTVGPSSTSPCDTNPSGVCYPTDHVGTSALVLDGAGQPIQRGDRVPNVRFIGFRAPNAHAVVDTTQAPAMISLADYYDPEQKLGPAGTGISVIRVMVNTAWCGPSNEEADFVSGANYTGQNSGGASFAKELEPLGVVFIEVLGEGAIVGQGATMSDLVSWVGHHEIDYTATVDGPLGYSPLSSYFPEAAIPFSLDIDARSMEILHIDIGLDIKADTTLKNWVAWVDTHAPL
jgi:hypothetical protein